ncbi:MAG: aldehyde dehydrogenase family protein [Jiangellales bacterium]
MFTFGGVGPGVAMQGISGTDVGPEAAKAHGLDVAVEELRAGLPDWVDASLGTRLRLLRVVKRRLAAEADGIVAAACSAHGVDRDGLWAGDQWFILAPFAFHLQALDEVLGRVSASQDPLSAGAVHTRPDGRVTVDVWPPTRLDQALFLGYGWRASVWMLPGTTGERVHAEAARAYRGAGFDAPGVALVLATGNFTAGPATDALAMLYHEGCVAIVKLNPVNAYLRPFLERVFAEIIDAGWLRFVEGGAEVGSYLAHHRGVDRVHMTGCATTYDALVWGTGPQSEANRADGRPLLDKPFTAELGGVNPVIVVPGRWTRKDLRRQAERIVYSKLQNAGHLCSSTQILVLPEGWDQTDVLLDEIRHLMRTLDPAAPFYPGTDAKVERAITDQPDVEALVPPDRRYLVHLDPDREHSLFTDDVFADVLGTVRLPAPTVADYLSNATQFANERLTGTLAATILIDPDTAKTEAEALDRTVAGLRYGAIGVNEWASIAFGLRYTTWGGFPGHTPESIGSGTGVVGNAFMLANPEKTVLTGPFRPLLKSPTLVTHHGRGPMFRQLINFRMTGDLRALPGVLAPALRA